MAEVRDVGAPDGVEVRLPSVVEQPAAFAPHDARVALAELPVEDVAVWIAVQRHCFSPLQLRESYAADRASARRGSMLRPIPRSEERRVGKECSTQCGG